MNKSEFIENVAEKAQMSRAAAARAVDAIFDTASGAVSEAVHGLGELSIPGFGKFKVKESAAREGRNPSTGATIQIAASKAAWDRGSVRFISNRDAGTGAQAAKPTRRSCKYEPKPGPPAARAQHP
mgnify:CR=1 FL=1